MLAITLQSARCQNEHNESVSHSDKRLNWKLVPPTCFPQGIPRCSTHRATDSSLLYNSIFRKHQNLGCATIAASIFIIISLNSVRIPSNKPGACPRKTSDIFSIQRENSGNILSRVLLCYAVIEKVTRTKFWLWKSIFTSAI